MHEPADDALAARLPAGVLRDVAPAYLEEPRGRYLGRAGLVAAPRTTEEVAAVVRACAEARVGIVPRGGGTGLVSGQVMPDGPAPLILSLERMTALRGAWPEENVLVAEAGMTLQAVRDAAEAAGRLFPLSLASQGTAAIGGCLATNAGGVTALRYGSARALCLGIEAVLPEIRQPLPGADWSVLIEVGLPEGLAPDAALEGLLVDAMERGLVLDGVIAQSGQQAADFWSLREHIPEANRRIGAIASHDISLPLSEIAGFIRDAGAALAGHGVRINCFGHLGDGNLHYNLFPAAGRQRGDYDALRPALSRLVHQMVVDRGGSFSAEHGVGRLKVAELAEWGDPARLAAMRAIKRALDPLGIMNPGAVLSAGA